MNFILEFEEILKNINLDNVSDIHITSDLPIMIRKNGELIYLENIIIKHQILNEYIKNI